MGERQSEMAQGLDMLVNRMSSELGVPRQWAARGLDLIPEFEVGASGEVGQVGPWLGKLSQEMGVEPEQMDELLTGMFEGKYGKMVDEYGRERVESPDWLAAKLSELNAQSGSDRGVGQATGVPTEGGTTVAEAAAGQGAREGEVGLSAEQAVKAKRMQEELAAKRQEMVGMVAAAVRDAMGMEDREVGDARAKAAQKYLPKADEGRVREAEAEREKRAERGMERRAKAREAREVREAKRKERGAEIAEQNRKDRVAAVRAARQARERRRQEALDRASEKKRKAREKGKEE